MTIRKTIFILLLTVLFLSACFSCADKIKTDTFDGNFSNSAGASADTSDGFGTHALTSSDALTSSSPAGINSTSGADGADSADDRALSASDDSAIYYISDSRPFDGNTSTMNGDQTPIEPLYTPFTYTKEDEKVTITGLSADFFGELTIPATINGAVVYAVGEKAFKDNTAITGVTVEDGVIIIGDCAFCGCKNLKTAVFPKSLEKIGYGALSGCCALQSLTVPFTGAEPKTGKSLKDYNFGYIFGKEKRDNCTKTTQYYHEDDYLNVSHADYYLPDLLKTVRVTGSDRATYLPYDAFRSCKTLDNVVIGGHIKNVGPFAFSCCTAKISFEDPVIERLEDDAFADYKGTSLAIPESVKYIGARAVSGCENLTHMTIPDGVEEIGLFAFSYSYALNSVTFGGGVKRLGMCAFYFCPNLKTVNFGKNLSEIDECAFSYCTALESITLPASLEKLGYDVFEKCFSLKTVNFEDADRWYVYNRTASGIALEKTALKKPSTAAKYLKTKYYDYQWAKHL